MKRLILLFLLLTGVSSAQLPGPGFAFWKSGVVAPAIDTIASKDTIVFWFRAADVIDTLGKADTDTTFTWPNRARYLEAYAGHNLNQTTDALKPIIRDSSGWRWVETDGVDDFMTAAGFTYSQPTTIFAVFRPLGPPYSTWSMYGMDGTGSGRQMAGYANGASQWAASAGTDVPLTPLAGLNHDSLRMFMIQYNGASTIVWNNGWADQTVSAGANVLTGMRIGSFATGAFPTRSHHMEYIVYHGALSAADLKIVWNILCRRYSVPHVRP